jgi:hypothetical protein
MQTCAADYVLTYLSTPKLQLVSLNVVGLAASVTHDHTLLSQFLRLAQPGGLGSPVISSGIVLV